MKILGIDTSNYTTSAALYDTVSGEIKQEKLLLPVKTASLACGRATLFSTTQSSFP